MSRALLFLLLLLTAAVFHGQVIDRMIAAVNNRVILQSDLDEAVRYEAFVEGRRVLPASTVETRAALERLIDQELLQQEMRDEAPRVDDAEVATKIAELRKEHGAASDQQWRQMLANAGLDESVLIERLRRQVATLRFLDQRLRPSVHVDAPQVEAYYRETLLPELRKAGVKNEPPLKDVEQRIREVLLQRRTDEMLTAWLHNLRQQSRTRVLIDDEQLAERQRAARFSATN